MYVIELTRNGHAVGYMSSLRSKAGRPFVESNRQMSRKFSLAADAECYLESQPWPSDSNFEPRVVSLPTTPEELDRPRCH